MQRDSRCCRTAHALALTGAFTLIELSIVLVIIGLLVAGVLTGKTLIETAQLRNLQKDVDMLQVAVNTFKSKYNCLPGDCPNATQFFPAGNCTYSSNPPIESSTAVCNGNGDGVIGGDGSGSDAGSAWFAQYENYYFWRTLNAAKMINFKIADSGYTMPPQTYQGFGIGNSDTALSSPRGSWPNSELFITNTYITEIQNAPSWGWNSTLMPLDYTNALVYMQYTFVFPLNPRYAGGLTSAQAQSVDTKYDDGFANSGKIIAAGSGLYRGCAVAPDANPVSYQPSSQPGSCGLIYLHFL